MVLGQSEKLLDITAVVLNWNWEVRGKASTTDVNFWKVHFSENKGSVIAKEDKGDTQRESILIFGYEEKTIVRNIDRNMPMDK